MADSNTATSQQEEKSWPFPGFLERMFPLILLPREHPYRICIQKEAELMMKDSVGKLAKGIVGPIISLPTVSASRAKSLRIVTATGNVVVSPTSEQLTDMEQGFVNREKENLLDSEVWQEKCSRVYDPNSSFWKK